MFDHIQPENQLKVGVLHVPEIAAAELQPFIGPVPGQLDRLRRDVVFPENRFPG